VTTNVRACVAADRCGRTCMARATSTWQTQECPPMALPQYPRRDVVAREAFKLLVTEQTPDRTSWDDLRERDRELWREHADGWAYVIATDAREQIAARKATEEGTDPAHAVRETRMGARTGQWDASLAPKPQTSMGDVFRRGGSIHLGSGGITITPFEQQPGRTVRRGNEPAAHYVITADGTVTRLQGPPPATPAALECPEPRDTRAETLHVVGPFVGRSASYPRTAHGLPAGTAECVCHEPTPLPAYDPDHPAYDAHQVIPVDAWLRCRACRGLYSR
jgi:hypothetical protein